jgi:hypothetical protein
MGKHNTHNLVNTNEKKRKKKGFLDVAVGM